MARAVAPQNLLDLRPVRLMEHRQEGERVTVLIPRFRSRWMGWLQRRLKRPHLRLRLDGVGSAVWLDCDGQRRVADIGQRLVDRFGDEVQPVWDRLGLFISKMREGKLIELKD